MDDECSGEPKASDTVAGGISIQQLAALGCLMFFILWFWTLLDDGRRQALANAGDAVAAIGTLAGSAAAILALQALRLQREALREQRVAQAEEMANQRRTLVVAHAAQRLTTIREKHSELAGMLEEAHQALRKACAAAGSPGPERAATAEGAKSALHRARARRDVLAMVDDSEERFAAVSEALRRLTEVMDECFRSTVPSDIVSLMALNEVLDQSRTAVAASLKTEWSRVVEGEAQGHGLPS